jgi:Flp pilus assembly protein TadD
MAEQACAVRSSTGKLSPRKDRLLLCLGEIALLCSYLAKLSQETAAANELVDASDLSRRGMASAGRRDFEHALADLTRACELEPTNPEYFYQRGMVHWQNQQADLARVDFEKAIELKQTAIRRSG